MGSCTVKFHVQGVGPGEGVLIVRSHGWGRGQGYRGSLYGEGGLDLF